MELYMYPTGGRIKCFCSVRDIRFYCPVPSLYSFEVINMDEKHFINKTDKMIEEFIEECEREAAKLEITVDYYLREFVV